MGYRPEMIDDEQQAYFFEATLSNDAPKIIELQRKAIKLFERYTSGLK